jgi:predicted nucleic-acid-binding Zn-ribbon protein
MDMSHLKQCPLCGGQQLTPVHVFTQTQVSGVFLKQQKRKARFFGPKTNIASTKAITCLSCGYTAFFAIEIENLVPDTQSI